MQARIQVQEEAFDLPDEHRRLLGTRTDIGAVATFMGLCRADNDGSAVYAMTLEHYPGMTEKALARIANDAAARWSVQGITIIHRIGRLLPGDPIVLVLVASAHRGDAFAACEFIMDYLKTEAPFWKKEATPHGERWVDARVSDAVAADRWA